MISSIVSEIWGLFMGPFLTFLAVFVQFFLALSEDVIIILKFWQLQSKDLKKLHLSKPKIHTPNFFHTQKNQGFGENMWFFSLTYPLCSADWESAAHLFTYVNYRFGYGIFLRLYHFNVIYLIMWMNKKS